MTIDRFIGSVRPSFNEIKVKGFLSANKGSTLMAQLGDRQLTLVLNSSGQLCYKEGNNIKLLPGDGKGLILLPESETLIEASAELQSVQETVALRPDPNLERMRWAINTIIDGTVRENRPRGWGELALRSTTEKKIIPVAKTEFKVTPEPAGSTGVKGRAYYRAALESIEDYKALMDSKNVMARRIVTTGNIIPRGDTKRQFEMRIKSNGNLRYQVLGSAQAFVKYEVWRDYDLPRRAANDERSHSTSR